MRTIDPTRPPLAPGTPGTAPGRTVSPGPADPADPVAAMFASRSVTGHVLRGVVGLVLAVLALWQAGSHPAALLLLVPAVLAWRGCPTCWAMGLVATMSRGRTRSS